MLLLLLLFDVSVVCMVRVALRSRLCRSCAASDLSTSNAPIAAPNSDELLRPGSGGTRVGMLYSNEGYLVWYPGTITRGIAALSRARKPDLSYSISFDGELKVCGPYKLSCNSLRLLEDASDDI